MINATNINMERVSNYQFGILEIIRHQYEVDSFECKEYENGHAVYSQGKQPLFACIFLTINSSSFYITKIMASSFCRSRTASSLHDR